MAFSKTKKSEMVSQYEKWIKQSEAIFLLGFNKMNMKEIDNLRSKMRDAGGQMHVTKNTLFKMALEKSGLDYGKLLEGSTLCGFVENDAASVAKVISISIKNSEVFKVKGAFLDGKMISETDVKALADLPPLPVMRAQLLGTINAPASKLVRTIAEPARSLAAVVKAYSEKQPAAA
jgi:large subunit ribosomal protein L10